MPSPPGAAGVEDVPAAVESEELSSLHAAAPIATTAMAAAPSGTSLRVNLREARMKHPCLGFVRLA